ncbi:MAG TPA: SRPBCC family protein [Candidatus Binatia bacterium]
MEIPRDLALERRQRSGPHFSEPLERRGDWNDGSLTTAARRAWDQKDLGVLVEGNEKTIARRLGWFSIGLGLMEVLAPKTLERFLGIRHHGLLLRILGLREIASGVGIFTGRRPSSWLWARVGGDVIDIASLGMAFNSDTAKPANIGLACAAVAGVTLLDLRCAQELSRNPNDDTALSTRTVEVRKSIQINCSPDAVYKFWRDFQNLPKFMSNLESVETLSDKRSHWCVIGPAGKRLEWDAEITDEQESRLIAWRSLEGAQIENCGFVRFETAPGGRGTHVKVQLQYSPPGGIFGARVAQLFGREPRQQIHEDLHHLKQIMETGEIITTEGQPAGRGSATSWKYDQAVRRQIDSRSDYQSSAV